MKTTVTGHGHTSAQTIKEFDNLVLEKVSSAGYDVKDVTSGKYKEGRLILTVYYWNNPAFVPRNPKDMTLEELEEACGMKKHIATYNPKTKEGWFFI